MFFSDGEAWESLGSYSEDVTWVDVPPETFDRSMPSESATFSLSVDINIENPPFFRASHTARAVSPSAHRQPDPSPEGSTCSGSDMLPPAEPPVTPVRSTQELASAFFLRSGDASSPCNRDGFDCDEILAWCLRNDVDVQECVSDILRNLNGGAHDELLAWCVRNDIDVEEWSVLGTKCYCEPAEDFQKKKQRRKRAIQNITTRQIRK
jgi:hypothetical protein